MLVTYISSIENYENLQREADEKFDRDFLELNLERLHGNEANLKEMKLI
jgi:hypothetical protein